MSLPVAMIVPTKRGLYAVVGCLRDSGKILAGPYASEAVAQEQLASVEAQCASDMYARLTVLPADSTLAARHNDAAADRAARYLAGAGQDGES